MKKIITFLIIMTSLNAHSEAAYGKLKENLYRHVSFLTRIHPFRHSENTASLNKAAAYIQKQFQKQGLKVKEQEFIVEGRIYKNIIAGYGEKSLPLVVVGAHYDVCGDQPGADDNASAVAGLLELARMVSQNRPRLDYRIEFVAYSLEEPPHFRTENMGSFVHAKSLYDQNAEVKLMIALEMIGYFTDEPGSQSYPVSSLRFFYPDRGNFIGIVGRLRDYAAIHKVKKAMKEKSGIPVESLAAPPGIPAVDFSDHSNYWAHHYHAIMITDTAFYRNPNYHEATDTIKTLDFEKMSEVVKGLYGAIIAL